MLACALADGVAHAGDVQASSSQQLHEQRRTPPAATRNSAAREKPRVTYMEDDGYGSMDSEDKEDEEAEKRAADAKAAAAVVPAFLESFEGLDDEVERVLGYRRGLIHRSLSIADASLTGSSLCSFTIVDYITSLKACMQVCRAAAMHEQPTSCTVDRDRRFITCQQQGSTESAWPAVSAQALQHHQSKWIAW